MRKLNEIEKQERDDLFLSTLAKLHKKHNADWIKTTHVREALFGKVDITRGPKLYKREKNYNRDVNRVRSLYKNLEKKGLLKTTKHKPKGLRECVYLRTDYEQEPAWRKWIRKNLWAVN